MYQRSDSLCCAGLLIDLTLKKQEFPHYGRANKMFFTLSDPERVEGL